MRRQVVDRIAPPIYGADRLRRDPDPALAVKLAADRGGMGDAEGMDLIAASSVLGVGHAVVASIRLRSEERIAVRRADMWIAALDALVVLALGATLLLLASSTGSAKSTPSLADRGFPVVVLWARRPARRHRRGRGDRPVRVLVARAPRPAHRPHPGLAPAPPRRCGCACGERSGAAVPHPRTLGGDGLRPQRPPRIGGVP